MPIIVYDKKGKPFSHNHPVDAKEAIATGNFFKFNPTQPAPPPPPKEVITAGQDISPIKTISMNGFETGNLPPEGQEGSGKEKEAEKPAPKEKEESQKDPEGPKKAKEAPAEKKAKEAPADSAPRKRTA